MWGVAVVWDYCGKDDVGDQEPTSTPSLLWYGQGDSEKPREVVAKSFKSLAMLAGARSVCLQSFFSIRG